MRARVVPVLIGLVTLLGPGLLLGLLLTATPAQACSCAPVSPADQAAAADAVVVGTVTGVVEDDASTASRLLIGVAVDEVFKGGVRDETLTVSTAATGDSCGLGPLPVGERYVFFLVGEETLTASSCGGSGAPTEQRTADLERTLGPGEAVVRPVERTLVGERDAPDVVRLAAPGGALVVVGLLGLLVLLPFRSRR